MSEVFEFFFQTSLTPFIEDPNEDDTTPGDGAEQATSHSLLNEVNLNRESHVSHALPPLTTFTYSQGVIWPVRELLSRARNEKPKSRSRGIPLVWTPRHKPGSN